MNKRIQYAHQAVLVLTQEAHGNLAGDPEDTFHTGHSKPIDNILCQSEWYSFGCLESFPLAASVSESARGGL